MTTTVIVALIIVVGAFTQGMAGFGFAFLSLPLISLFIDFKTSVVLLVLLAQVLNVIILYMHGVMPPWKHLLPLTLATLPGVPVGVYMLQYVSVPVLQGTLGVILVLYCLYLWFGRPTPRRIGRAWIVVAGFIAGCLGGALNSQGPPVMVYVTLQAWDKDKIKSTLISFFFLSGIFVVIAQASQGLVTMETLKLAGLCAPGLLVGAGLGRYAYCKLGEGGYRTVFIGLLFALGVFMIVKSSGGVI